MNDQNQDEQFEEQQEPLLDENGNPIEEQPAEEDNGSHKYAGIISWVVSGAMHATILMLMATIVFLSKDPEQETPPVKITAIPPPPEKKEEKPKMDRQLLDPKVTLDVETKSDKEAPITQLDVKVDENAERETETDSPVPKGREEAVADSEMGGSGAFMAIGAGGGSAGMFGSRTGGGRKRATSMHGGSKGSESAVDAALRWFKKHQSPDGKWDAERYFTNCTEDPKCEPGSLFNHAAEEVNTAMTGYALLCFLGAGYDHKTPNKYKPTVKKGVDWLVSTQKPNGLLGSRNYENAIAAMALAEAYAMTNDPDLRGPAQKAIDMILQRQNQDSKAAGAETSGGAGLGWDYVGPNTRNDASVTGWNVMALKSAYAGGLNVKTGMSSAKRWLELAWKANNDGKAGHADWHKLDPYKDESVFSYCWPTGATEYEDKGFGHRNMAPVGMVCAVFLGHKSGDPMLETMANWVMNKQTPKAYPTNTYYMYYNTLGVFQVGGDKWKEWNSTVRDMLVNAQKRGEGCLDGSWDWQGTNFHGSEIGRVLSTAYCTLCLEVYYRYAQVAGKGGGH